MPSALISLKTKEADVKNWANKKLIQSWDTAVMAIGGLAVGLFVAGAVIVGDPTAETIDLEAMDRPAMEVECLPLDMQTGLTQQESVC